MRCSWLRYLLRLASPILRQFCANSAPYSASPSGAVPKSGGRSWMTAGGSDGGGLSPPLVQKCSASPSGVGAEVSALSAVGSWMMPPGSVSIGGGGRF